MKRVVTYILGGLALIASAVAAAQVQSPEGNPSFGTPAPSPFIVVEVYTCPKFGQKQNSMGHFEGTSLIGTLLGHRELGITLAFIPDQTAVEAREKLGAVIDELRAQGGPFASPDHIAVPVTSQYSTKEGTPCPSLQTGNAVES